MTALLLPLFELRAEYIRAVMSAPAHLGPWEALAHGIMTTIEASNDLHLAALSERILSTLVHKSASVEMPDREADDAHTHALEASLLKRLGSEDRLALSLLIANGDHILRLALRAHLDGEDPRALTTHAFALLQGQ